ncbi:Protein ZGRF1, partial [Bienertia sinuspersici]
MASSHQSIGSGSSRSRSEQNRVVLCYHNEPAPVKTVRYNGPTLGRRFYGCPNWPNNTCGFFRWADEVDDIRQLQFKIQEYITEIAELQMSHEMVEEEYKKLKKKYDKQQEELEESWMENATIRTGLYSANADKKLMLTL